MHTPTPWETKHIGKNLYIEAKDGGFICDMQLSDALGEIGDPNQTKADAALIVKAVNSYAAMKEALEHIQNLAEENTHSPQDGYAMIEEWARKALKLAEGQSDRT